MLVLCVRATHPFHALLSQGEQAPGPPRPHTHPPHCPPQAYFDTKATNIQRHWRGFWSRKFLFDFYARKLYLQHVARVNAQVRGLGRQQQPGAARTHLLQRRLLYAPPPGALPRQALQRRMLNTAGAHGSVAAATHPQVRAEVAEEGERSAVQQKALAEAAARKAFETKVGG